MPRHRDAVLELVFVLGMDAGAVLDRLGDPLGRRQRRELVGIDARERISAEQNRLAGIPVSGARIADQADRQIRIADAPIDPSSVPRSVA